MPEHDFILPNGLGGSKGHGTIAQRLLANGMDTKALRTNATLRKEEWLEFDTALVETARDRLVAVGDLLSRGLTLNLKNAMGTTVIEWETIGQMRPAEVNMDGITRAAADRPNYESVLLPIPITHENFQFNIRALEASRLLGNALDTSSVIEATLQVVESLESQLFNGVSITFGGGTIYGYTNHPQRNTVSLHQVWDHVNQTGELIVADVLSLIAAAHVDRMFGPYVIYVPTDYWIPLVDDFKADGDRTTLERILAIPNIDAVRVSDKLADDNIVMVQMTKNVVDMVVGFQPRLLEWSGEGGLQAFFKVMAIMVPRVKATQTGQSGVVHMS